MDRKNRTRILIEGSRELAEKFRAEVEARHEVTVIEPPDEGMVMIKLRETAKRRLFYLGEVLVTEAKVLVGDALGIGLIAGDDPDAAYSLAVIDAACNAGLGVTRGWDELLSAEAAAIRERRLAEAARIRETRVSFESMDAGQA